MKRVIGEPKEKEPLHLFLEDWHDDEAGIVLVGQMTNGSRELLLTIDENGVIWTGDCLSVELGRYTNGKLKWNSGFKG